jgi:hypothetical protein
MGNTHNKDNQLDTELLKGLMPKKYRKHINDELVDELNTLIDDPEYGEQFKEEFLTHANVLEHNANWSLEKYKNAVKFFSLVQQEMSLVDAYCIVFPERLKARYARGESKLNMGGEASRYNSSELVNKIRQQALVPLHLVNQGLLQQAINKQAQLMMTAKSEMVQQKASETLIRELRPPETSKIELDIGVKQSDTIADLRKAAEDLAMAQLNNIKAGVAVKQIAESKIIDTEVSE